jgi:hypothetical protein
VLSFEENNGLKPKLERCMYFASIWNPSEGFGELVSKADLEDTADQTGPDYSAQVTTQIED